MNALWLLWSVSAHAATLTVDPSDPSSFATIADAVTAAATGDTVSIVAGTYSECIDTAGKDLTFSGPSSGAAATVDGADLCTSAFSISGGESVTVQQLSVTNSSGRAFYLGSGSLLLEGVEVSSSGSNTISGGAIHVSGGTLTTRDCTFTDNVATEGGAIYLYSSVSWTDEGSVFSGNTATGSGGAIFAYAYHTLRLSGTTLSENEAGGSGGALAVSWYSSLELSNAELIDNTAENHGGALSTYVVTGDFLVSDSRFARNEARTGRGGAIHTEWYSLLQVVDSTLEDNRSADGGGAINQWYETSGYGERNQFTGNTTGGHGGGWYWNPYQGGADDLAVYDSSFTDNESGGWGGGLHTSWANEIHIEGSTFDRNTAGGNGGGFGVYVTSALTMHGNRFCGNTATLGGGAQVEWAGLDHITNTTFIDNTADRGGGLFRYVSYAGVSQYNSFVGNSASWGGAFLDEWGATTLDNTAFFHNVGGALFTDFASTASNTSVQYDGWGDNDPIDGTGYFWVEYGVDGNVSGDPKFVRYSAGADCDTQDLHPLSGSVLIDAAHPTDLDPNGTRADIGAFGGPDAPIEDHDGDGADTTTDCLDGDPEVHPDADEWCDGIDNNCDGLTDGTDALDAATWYADLDGDGYGDASTGTVGCGATGMVTTAGDCDDTAPEVFPGAEDDWYDGVDANCDAANDFDSDGDGWEKPVGDNGGRDCDDTDPATWPGADDTPGDGIDQDCDGADDIARDPEPEEEDPVVQAEQDAPADRDKSGCSTAGTGSTPGLWLVGLLVFIRKRGSNPSGNGTADTVHSP